MELEERDRRLIRAGLLDPPPLFHVTTDPHPSGEFVSISPDGTPILHCHQKQALALKIKCQFLLILAGWQSGKSSIGPPWLVNEMRRQGPGNYLAAGPSFKLLDRYPVRGIDRLLGRILGLGEVIGGAMGEFRVSEAGHAKLWPESKWPTYDPKEPSRIIFGHADNPDSLASFTGKGAWLDEPGQRRFKQESNEEIRGRLSTTGGRMLYTSRPYVFHWLKTDVYDRADQNRLTREKNKELQSRGEELLALLRENQGYEVVEFESIDNPAFKREEWDSARLTMPAWKFDMKYRGRFTRPAGAIYDCFEPEAHVVQAVPIPPEWSRVIGIDFGSPNFSGCFIAEEREEIPGPPLGNAPKRYKKTGRRVVYAEYRPDNPATAKEHVAAMRKIERDLRKKWEQPTILDMWRPAICIGGSKSEGQWRNEFQAVGWPIQPPDTPEVEVQIDRVYGAFKTQQLFISEACQRLIDEIRNYSRVVDDEGNPTNEIEDKEIWHGADSLRYALALLERKNTDFYIGVF